MSHTRKVVLVMVDTQRTDMLGCYGNAGMKTPSLDRLAAEGIRFDRAYTCQPVCGPARAGMFTGTFPHSNGVWANSMALGDNVKTIGQRLRDSGIHTAYVGKWHLDGPYRGGFTPPGPRRQGFDYWAASDCCHNYMRSWYYRDTPEPIWIDGYDADHFTGLTIDYMRSHCDMPFCLFL